MVGFESDPPGCEAETKPPYHHAPCKMFLKIHQENQTSIKVFYSSPYSFPPQVISYNLRTENYLFI